MSAHLMLVFSEAPDDLVEEYHAWYETHVSEVLATRGFASGQRFSRVDFEAVSKGSLPRFLAAYEIEGDLEAAIADLRRILETTTGLGERLEPAVPFTPVQIYTSLGAKRLAE